MTTIAKLPKFYDKKDKTNKFNELANAVKELKKSGKLTANEVADIEDALDCFKYAGDAFTRNHVITVINEMITFVNCR